jgi:hypothetical protein
MVILNPLPFSEEEIGNVVTKKFVNSWRSWRAWREKKGKGRGVPDNRQKKPAVQRGGLELYGPETWVTGVRRHR